MVGLELERTELDVEIRRLAAIAFGRGLLVAVDGMGEVAEVTDRVFAELDRVRGEAAS